MHWTTEPFIELHELLQSIETASLPTLVQVFDQLKEDFQAFLKTPAKSETSRQKLQKGKITIDETEYEVNQDFVNVACTLADELGIDELAAAELVQNASGDSSRLDMSPLESGVAMYHVRRQYMLELTRFFLHTATEESSLGQHCKQVLAKLDNMVQKTLDAMKDIRTALLDLEEKEKRGQFLGQTQNAEFVQILKLRRDFLYREHDTLGQVLVGLVENKITTDEFFKILGEIQEQQAYNTLFIHYLPSIMVYTSTFDPMLKMTMHDGTEADAKKVLQRIKEKREWKLPFARGCIELMFLTYYAGKCRNSEDGTVGDYQNEILVPVRRAIDDGALELLMAVASDIGKKRPVQSFDFKQILQARVPFVEVDLSDSFLGIITAALERHVEGFVSNLADILKEMRLSEEDTFMAMQEEDAPLDDTPGVDLERFFMFVSHLYFNRPGASQPFWDDSEGNLHGFVQWASQCHVPFMAASFCDMLASLAAGQECANAVHRFLLQHITVKARKASRITYDYIFKAFYYYAEQLQPESAPPQNTLSNARVMLPAQDIPDLDDDTMIVLCSYFRLLTTVVREDATAREEVMSGETDVLGLLFNLLKTQTSLIGPVFDVVAAFALTDSSTSLAKLWEILDNWAFNSVVYSPDGGVILPSMPARGRLYNLFKSFNDILGLVTLLETLMRLPKCEGLYMLPYPEDLGGKYRSPGVWPYVDFLINEVFLSSNAPGFSQTDQLALQLPCLLFMKHALQLFDPEIARLSVTAGVSPDVVVKSQSFLTYLKVHPCAPTMSHLFDDKTYNLLIGLASTGIDAIGEKREDNELVQTVQTSLELINLILDLQGVFIDIIVNEFKFGENGPQFSTHGLRSFEDALLFNLPVVSHLALYVGSANLNLARPSLRLLERLSSSPQFLTSTGSTLDSRIKKNRLLSALETVDESIRIKEGFIEQLERDVDSYEGSTESMDGVQIKLEVLRFLITNLKYHAGEPNIAHFLLGFDVNGDGSLSFSEERGGIGSEVSLLHSVLSLLEYAIASTNEHDIEFRQSQLSSACSEIVLLLTGNNNSCLLVLEYLRENDFMLTSLNNEPIIGSKALWSGLPFDQTNQFLTGESVETMIAFFTHRMALLEYLSVETHVSADNGALSLLSRYVDSLVNLNVNSVFQSARILSFLDMLEFQTGDELQNEVPNVQVFGPQVVEHFYRAEYEQDDETAATELKHLLKLKGLEFVAQQKMESLDDPGYVRACEDIVQTFCRARMSQRLRNIQLSCLMAWCKLVLVVVNDTELSAINRSTFILETFQTIIPKLVDYASWDVAFAEQLASLAVSLYEVYHTDVKKIGHDKVAEYDRTHALFKAALNSMQTPLSTAELRADLYVICYQYLKSCMDSPALVASNVQIVRNTGDKLLEIVCNDAISSDGMPRVTALVFLQVLCALSAAAGSSFLLDGLVRYNLLLILVRSVKRIDGEIARRQQLSEMQLFYEINVFKATLCFLLQVAQTRSGANQMVQCGLFNTLESCELLKIDPDVGIGVKSRPSTASTASGSDHHHHHHHHHHHSQQQHSPAQTFYEVLIPVFQLASAVLLSMGPENTPVITRLQRFVDSNTQLIGAVLKKEVVQGAGDAKLQDLVKLVVLLVSLTQD